MNKSRQHQQADKIKRERKSDIINPLMELFNTTDKMLLEKHLI
jgi:hypothetical protein